MTPTEKYFLQRANARLARWFPRLRNLIRLASRLCLLLGLFLLIEAIANMALTHGAWWQARTGNPLADRAWPEALLGLWFVIRGLWGKKSPQTYCRCFWGPFAGYAGPYRVVMGCLMVSWALLYSNDCAPLLLTVLTWTTLGIAGITAPLHWKEPTQPPEEEDLGINPSTGFPLVSDGIDAGGYTLGHNSHQL